MPTNPFCPDYGTVLHFRFVIPEVWAPINLALQPKGDSGTILVHIDFRYPDNVVAINTKRGNKWGQEHHHPFAYTDKQYSGTLTPGRDAIILAVRGTEIAIPYDGFAIGDIDFAATTGPITINAAPPADERLMRAWIFARQPFNPASFPMREEKLKAVKRQGASVVLFCEDEALDEDFVGAIAAVVDEVLVISNATPSLLPRIRQMQKRLFNLKFFMFNGFSDDFMEKPVGERNYENIAFAYSKASYRNIVFAPKTRNAFVANDFIRFVATNRLRGRRDNYVICDPRSGVVVAFAAGEHFGLARFPDRTELAYGYLCKSRLLCVEDGLLESCDDILRIDLPDEARVPYYAGRPFSPKILNWADETSRQAPRLPDLAVMVVSCRKYRGQQEEIRNSWGAMVGAAGIPVFYLEGNPSLPATTEMDDTLFVNCADTYEALSEKVARAFIYLWRTYGFQHILKIDDDCVLNPVRLIQTPLERYEYIGTAINRGRNSIADWHHGASFNEQINDLYVSLADDSSWYDGQGSYVLSHAAIEALAERLPQMTGSLYEDYGMGRVLADAGIKAVLTEADFLSVRYPWAGDEHLKSMGVVSDVPRDVEIDDVFAKMRKLDALGDLQEFHKAFGIEWSAAKGK